jgi:hypothetical protein
MYWSLKNSKLSQKYMGWETENMDIHPNRLVNFLYTFSNMI